MPAPAPTFKCTCAKCLCHPDGYEYQSRNLITKHISKYGPALPLDRQEANPNRGQTQAQEGLLLESQNELRQVMVTQGLNQDMILGAAGNNVNFFDDDDFHWNEDELAGHRPHQPQELQEPELPGALYNQQPHGAAAEPADRVWMLVMPPDVQTPGSDADEEDLPVIVPLAFKERPSVRLAYLRAAIGNVYDHLSVLQATNGLNATLDSLFIENKEVWAVARHGMSEIQILIMSSIFSCLLKYKEYTRMHIPAPINLHHSKVD
ncbi:hypothetical protein C0993_008583 [Termitomyces sp. T159_Od127]|nr:hypothetical protein C0993_008583 [Termitomyces sp. T159_Od127]